MCEFLHIVNVLKFNELILFGRRPFSFPDIITNMERLIQKKFQNDYDMERLIELFIKCLKRYYRDVHIDQNCTTFMFLVFLYTRINFL